MTTSVHSFTFFPSVFYVIFSTRHLPAALFHFQFPSNQGNSPILEEIASMNSSYCT